MNSACYLDIETMTWSTIQCETDEQPSPREYAGITYDDRLSRMIIFGGWNNGWMNDMYALSVSKIVGPPYAITAIDPPLSQMSGGVLIKI